MIARGLRSRPRRARALGPSRDERPASGAFVGCAGPRAGQRARAPRRRAESRAQGCRPRRCPDPRPQARTKRERASPRAPATPGEASAWRRGSHAHPSRCAARDHPRPRRRTDPPRVCELALRREAALQRRAQQLRDEALQLVLPHVIALGTPRVQLTARCGAEPSPTSSARCNPAAPQAGARSSARSPRDERPLPRWSHAPCSKIGVGGLSRIQRLRT